MTICRFFCTAGFRFLGGGGIPGICGAPPDCDGSKASEFCRESNDFEGRADCENGVVGDVRPAAVLALPFAFADKTVDSCGEVGLLTAGVAALLMAERAMYVSTHRAKWMS